MPALQQDMPDITKILILLPAYNEADNVGGVIDDIRLVISNLEYACDILVVDDGSTDNTIDIARERKAEVVRLPLNAGIGVALQAGFKFGLECGYEAIVRLDADGQHVASYIPAVLEPVLSGEADLCIGSRFLKRQGYQASGMRRLGIAWFSALVKLLFGKTVTDPTSGFQAMSRRLVELYARDYASDYPEVEALVNTLRNGFEVKEAPIVMKERQAGRSSIDWFESIYYALKVTTVVFVSILKGRRKE